MFAEFIDSLKALAGEANGVQSGLQTPMNPVNSLETSSYSHMHLM